VVDFNSWNAKLQPNDLGLVGDDLAAGGDYDQAYQAGVAAPAVSAGFNGDNGGSGNR
jgi:hypothetical protein